MSYKELIDALYKGCSEEVMSIRMEAETEGKEIMLDAELRLEELRKRHDKMKTAAIRELEDAILKDAEKRAGTVRLLSENALTVRLYRSAYSALGRLRDDAYAGIFAGLVRELPDYSWKTVRVNPLDADIAAANFPGAEIFADNNISGGLEVISEDGKIRVNNTFEKRLERGWANILPGIIRQVKGD